jgi:hypothetical protein
MMRRTARRDCELGDSGIGELELSRAGIPVLARSVFVVFGIPQSLDSPISGGRRC